MTDQQENNGIKRLAAAMIVQAIVDLQLSTREKLRNKIVEHDAEKWIAGEYKDGLSIEMCCETLGRNLDDVLAKIQQPSLEALRKRRGVSRC